MKESLDFNQIFLPAYDFLVYRRDNDLERFTNQINLTRESLLKCTEVLSNNHNKALLTEFELKIDQVFHIIYNSKKVKDKIQIALSRDFLKLMTIAISEGIYQK